MKKWLTGLLSAALLAGNLPVYALNTAYAAEEDGFLQMRRILLRVVPRKSEVHTK